MIASRRIFIVSSSHPYHNCKIPFLYEHVMTPSMTPRRRRYLFLLSISSRASTSHIVFAPIMFALHSHSVSPYQSRSSRARHHRSSTITFTCEPFDKPKVLYHQVTFRHPPTQWVLSIAPCISCTIRIVGFVLFVPIPPTLPRIFILFRHLVPFSYSS
ncbi:hypothetical protein V8E52_002692 [Russula decolorans]|jgi:hypothetical protein